MEDVSVTGDAHDQPAEQEADTEPSEPAPAPHRRGRWRVLFYTIVALTLAALVVSILVPP